MNQPQAAASDQAAQPMTQEQRTIIQQAHQIATLSNMLENTINRANQLGVVVKSQAQALESANKQIEALKADPPLAPVAAATAKAIRRSKKA